MRNINEIRILLACEESDELRGRFEAKGFDAWSCDKQQNRKKSPKHLRVDVMTVINQEWDVMIAFPPCTHLAGSGAKHFARKSAEGIQQKGIELFMAMVNAPIGMIAVENPVGIMSTLYRKPDQIIQPYFFGDEAQKTTCLWLKNLPKLFHNSEPDLFSQDVTHTGKGEFFTYKNRKTGKIEKQPMWYAETKGFGGRKAVVDPSKVRSKTFPGIAEAMVEQWSEHIIRKLVNNN